MVLREWTPDDAADMLAIYGDADVMRFLGGNSKPKETLNECLASIDNIRQKQVERDPLGFGFWAIEDKSTGKVVGSVLLKELPPENKEIEIGWHLGKFAWGKGYATEAASCLLEYGFGELKLPTILAVVFPENSASIRVTERLGMRPQGITSKYYDLELQLFRLDRVEN